MRPRNKSDLGTTVVKKIEDFSMPKHRGAEKTELERRGKVREVSRSRSHRGLLTEVGSLNFILRAM